MTRSLAIMLAFPAAALLAFALMGWTSPTAMDAAYCQPEDREWHQWAPRGAGQLRGPEVPEGEVWRVRAAGVALKDPPEWQPTYYEGGTYMVQIERRVRSQGFACCWKVPIARNVLPVSATPVLPVEIVPFELRWGEALSARVKWSNKDTTAALGLLMLYDAYPEGCL